VATCWVLPQGPHPWTPGSPPGGGVRPAGGGEHHPGPGQSVAGAGLSRRAPHHPAAPQPLEQPRARMQALLLLAGSSRNPHLARGGLPGGEAGDCDPQGQRRSLLRLQDGHRLRQAGGHVDGHRLARVLEASYEEVEKMAKIDEFIDAYSDDFLYLLEAPRALITHPLRGDYTFEEFLNASFCCLFIAWVFQAIEIMLQTWQERDQIGILSQYFKEGFSNGYRVNALCPAFRQASIPVHPDVFKDFLAIKYLRNTIVHGR